MEIRDMSYEEYYYIFGIFNFEKALSLIDERKKKQLSDIKMNQEVVKKHTEKLVFFIQKIINKEVQTLEEYDLLRRAAIICNSQIDLLYHKSSREYTGIPQLLGVVSRGSIFFVHWFTTISTVVMIFAVAVFLGIGVLFNDLFLLVFSSIMIFVIGLLLVLSYFRSQYTFVADRSRRNTNKYMYPVSKEYKPLTDEIFGIIMSLVK